MANLKSIHDVVWDEDNETFVEESIGELLLHEGKVFSAHETFRSMSTGVFGEVYLKTPDSTVGVHAAVYFTSSGVAEFSVRRSCTVAASGIASVAINSNHNSSRSNLSSVRRSATLAASGTELGLKYGGGQGIFAAQGASAGNRSKKIYKTETGYIFRIEPKTANITGTIEVEWWEH